MSEKQDPTPSRWWGSFQVPSGASRRWEVGPLRFQITRRDQEWQMEWWRGLEAEPRILPGAPEPCPPAAERSRFGLSGTSPALHLTPLLADRALVCRPEIPFLVMPGQEVHLRIGAPIWVKIEVGGGLTLTELPVFRLSDTWFGASTMEGALCYASQTHLLPADAPSEVPDWRALTRLRIHNRASDPLKLERLCLPLPRLALYVNGGDFWTSSVSLVRPEGGGEQAIFHVDPEPPPGAQFMASPPRLPPGDHPLLRVFNSLFL